MTVSEEKKAEIDAMDYTSMKFLWQLKKRRESNDTTISLS